MSEANNETHKPGETLRIGLISTGERAADLAVSLAAADGGVFAAQAGVAQGAALAGVEWFSDLRVMIAQASLDAVVIDLSPRDGVDVGLIALEYGVGVWRWPPLGRTFGEAAQVIRTIRERGVAYRVASRHEQVGEALAQALSAQRDFSPRVTEIDVYGSGPPLDSWRSSAVDAGGGVLMHAAYDALESLVAVRGLPLAVHAATAKARRRPDEPPRETEDFAIATLRYDVGAASVRACWDIPPYRCVTRHHGRDKTVRFSPSDAVLLGADGIEEQTVAIPDGPLDWEMQRFLAMLRGQTPAFETDAVLDRHLAATALLEASYLAARTGQFENPRKLYQVEGWPEPKL